MLIRTYYGYFYKRLFNRATFSSVLVIIVMFLLAYGTVARADPQPNDLAAYFVEEEIPRKALVVGMRHYDNLNEIPSGIKDAEDMGKKLENLDFSVTYALDKGADDLWEAIKAFQKTLNRGDVAVFYFSGHGFQWKGMNFLVPKDAPKIVSDNKVPVVNIPLSDIIYRFKSQEAGFSLLIIDACRTNTLNVRKGRAIPKEIGGGFAEVKVVPPQLVVAFAASFGQVAFTPPDPEENSFYTKHLIKNIDRSGIDINQILDSVSLSVYREWMERYLRSNEWKKWEQQPEKKSIVSGNFYPKPDAETLKIAKDAWFLALETRDLSFILEFWLKWPASRYARSARKWLDNFVNRVATSGDTRELKVVTPTSGEPSSLVRIRGERLAVPTISQVTIYGIPLANAVTENVEVFDQPNETAQRIASLKLGETVGVLKTQPVIDHRYYAIPPPKNTIWSKVLIDPNTSYERVGYVKDVVKIEEHPYFGVLRLKPTNRADLLDGKVFVVEVELASRAESETSGHLSEPIPLAELNDAAESERATALKGLDFSHALIHVSLRRFIEGAHSSQEASQFALLRALQIRKALISSGAKKENIFIPISQDFSLEKMDDSDFDEVHVFLP